MKFSFLNGEISRLHSAAFLLGAAGLLSRFLGIFRDRLLAGRFGAAGELDVYYAAFQIPDFLSTLFILGAGSAAILPVFQEELAHSKERARRIISALHTGFFLGAGLCGLVVFFAAPLVIRFIAPGFDAAGQMRVVELTRIILLSPLLLGLSSILSSVTQAYSRFWAYALAPIFYNIGIIMGIVVLVPFFGLKGLAFGVVAGACMHFLVQLVTASNLGFRPEFALSGAGEGISKVISASLPRVLSLSLGQITFLGAIALASTLAEGSISVMQLAYNLFSVPVGILGVSYAVALFPRLNKSYLTRDATLFYSEFFIGVRTIIFWIAPILVLFIVLRAHIVRVALGTGLFSWEDTRLTAAVLAALMVTLISSSLVSLFMRAFYALEDTWRPLAINITASAISLSCAYIFTKLFRPGAWVFQPVLVSLFRITDLPHPEIVGLVLGFALGQAVNGILLYSALMQLARRKLGAHSKNPYHGFAGVVVASGAAAAIGYTVRASFSQALPLVSFLHVFVQAAAVVIAGFGVYCAMLHWLGNEEFSALSRVLQRRIFGLRFLPKVWSDDTTTPE